MLNIEHPIELVPQIMPTPQGLLGESINLRPGVAVAEETTFSIDKKNVITVANLQENFISGYHRMVKSIYFNPPDWRGDFIEEEQEEPELDLELVEELANAILEKKIH